MKPKRFTPSYEAASQAEYNAEVERCEASAELPWWQRARGCKRLGHLMIGGGRRTARYGEPHPEESEATTERLAGSQPPWDARTQAPSLRNPKLRPAVVAIAQAIERYRQHQPQGEVGFLVPTTPGPLIRAGMPRRAAWILVSRAAGKFYPEVAPAALQLSFPATVQLALGTPTMEQIQIEPGGPVYQFQFAGRRSWGYVEEISVREGGVSERKARAQVLIDADGIAMAYGRWRAKDRGRPYRREADDPQFFTHLFKQLQVQMQALLARWGAKQLVLEVFLSNLTNAWEVVLSAGLLTGEHSNLPDRAASSVGINYKNLSGVGLADLAPLLQRLSRRKKRKGRTLPPTTRKNPSTMTQPADNPLLQLVISEQAKGQFVPVPGKPGRVYWPISKQTLRKQPDGSYRKVKTYVGLKDTTADRARSWLGITDYARSSTMAKKNRKNSRRNSRKNSRKNPGAPSPWADMYSKAPFGARRAPPIARRNSAMLSKVAKRSQQLVKQGYDKSSAMKQAWAEARGNPWDNPVRPSLVPSPYDWDDDTMIPTALARPNARAHSSDWDYHPTYSQFEGQFSTDEGWTHGRQPANRRNPEVKRAIFPGKCVVCGGAFTRGEPIADSGQRGPRGGKKMAHLDCC